MLEKNMEEIQGYIPYPKPEVFLEKQVQVTAIGSIASYEFDHVEYSETEGMLTYKKGLLFPTKGFVFPQAIQCINVAKRLLIDSITLAKEKMILGLYIPLLFSSFKTKIKFLNRFIAVYNRSMIQIIKGVALKRKEMINLASELQGTIETFLKEIGIDNVSNQNPDDRLAIYDKDGRFLGNAETLALILATIINYDNAYHFRLVDVLSETKQKELLKDPIKEIKRVIEIYLERELAAQVKTKVKTIVLMLRILFLFKPIKTAFQKAIAQTNWKNLVYDDIWRYNVLERGDYLFMGMTFPERATIFSAMHNFQPPQQLNFTI